MATLTSQPILNTKNNIFDERNNTFELQKFLRKISETDSSVPFLNTDGIYGPETTEAVRAFQETRNIPQTGVADYETWDRIFNEYQNIIKLTDKALPFHVYPAEILEIKPGDSGDAVVVIQLLLNKFASKYKNFKSVNVTGRYGNETYEAVKNFQTFTLLEPTGIVNRPTWNEMINLYTAFLIND